MEVTRRWQPLPLELPEVLAELLGQLPPSGSRKLVLAPQTPPPVAVGGWRGALHREPRIRCAVNRTTVAGATYWVELVGEPALAHPADIPIPAGAIRRDRAVRAGTFTLPQGWDELTSARAIIAMADALTVTPVRPWRVARRYNVGSPF